MTWCLLDALSLIVREPVTEPSTVGLKFTEIAQLFPAGTDPPHALVWLNPPVVRDSRDTELAIAVVAERYAFARACGADRMLAETQDLAIEIARRSGVPLKIAAKVDVVDRQYFEAEIKPLIHPPHVEYIGEIDDAERSEFLGGARALLFPIDWPEPFGLAMVEALACGTPVIARPCGSVPEVMRPGVSGFVARELDELVAAVDKIDSIPRDQCCRYFEERFTTDTMIDRYEQVYDRLIESSEIEPQIFLDQVAVAARQDGA